MSKDSQKTLQREVADKFIKSTIYVILGILVITFLLIQPYNLICRIKKNCQPLSIKSLLMKKNGQQTTLINFNSRIAEGLEAIVALYPEKKDILVKNGKNISVNYVAKNLSDKNIIITNNFYVDPPEVEKYLEKIECLCFKNQPINAHEEVLIPTNFRINPEIENDNALKKIKEVTIIYETSLVK